MTYVLENISDELDRAIRDRAAAQNTSPEQAILDELQRSFVVGGAPKKLRDLSGIAGARTIDDAARAAFAEQRQIDPELWK